MNEGQLQDLVTRRYDAKFGNDQGGPTIYLPADEITLTEPLRIQQSAHLRIIGRGKNSTRLNYVGDPTGDVINFAKCINSTLQGFSITGVCANGVAFDTKVDTPLSFPISSENRCIDMKISGGAVSGFRIIRGPNSEFHLYEDCEADGCTVAGFHIGPGSGQAHRIMYRRCKSSNCDRGLWGQYGNYWNWLDGESEDNNVDFSVGNFWIQTSVIGHRSTGARSCYVTGGEWSPMSQRFERILWEGAPNNNRSRVLKFSSEGPIYIKNCTFRSTNGKSLYIHQQDADFGMMTCQNLVFEYDNPPNGDMPQQPISQYEAKHLITDRGITLKDNTSGNIERVIPTRISTKTRLDGRTQVPLVDTTYVTGEVQEWTLSGSGDTFGLPASNGSEIRSFTLAWDTILNSLIINRQAQWNMDGQTSVHFLWNLGPNDDMWQLRLGAGKGTDELFYIQTGVRYRLVFRHNRDYRDNQARQKLFSQWGTVVQTTSLIDNGTNTVRLGALQNNDPPTGRLIGTIDNMYVWDRALSDAECNAELEQGIGLQGYDR